MHCSAALRFALPALVLTGGLGLAQTSEAKPNITRKGGQWGVTLGGSACIPGQAKCNRDDVLDGGIGVDGKTAPSFGLGAELGYRLKPWMYVGAHYNFGLFNTNYEFTTPNTATTYKHAYQNSIYGVFKPILPVWRFDFGLAMGPGFSRQVFKMANGNKDYSQGFSWVFSPTIDIFVTRRIFVGIKADILLNAHGKTCHERANTTDCAKETASTDLAPVHQVIFGLHVGGTFL